MTFAALRPIVDALMYEGYCLYPYRPDAVKNAAYRWMFGTLYPRAFAETAGGADPWWMQTECLVRGAEATALEVAVRFLRVGGGDVADREITARAGIGEVLGHARQAPFADGAPPRLERVEGGLVLAAERCGEDVFRVTVRVENVTPLAGAARDAALGRALVSTHTLLAVHGGEFISLLDPPAEARAAAATCRNVGTWPVLAGRPGSTDTLLSSPIILYDYPSVAPESAGDLFDATEIDELLTLRILTLTPEEKLAMRAADPRLRALLERTESLGTEARQRLHGAIRARRRAGAVDVDVWPGQRVRLNPAARADIFDLALGGKTATVVSIEEDYDGRRFVAVTVDDDPGRDLGVQGLPGHRFFFRVEEVEPLS